NCGCRRKEVFAALLDTRLRKDPLKPLLIYPPLETAPQILKPGHTVGDTGRGASFSTVDGLQDGRHAREPGGPLDSLQGRDSLRVRTPAGKPFQEFFPPFRGVDDPIPCGFHRAIDPRGCRISDPGNEGVYGAQRPAPSSRHLAVDPRGCFFPDPVQKLRHRSNGPIPRGLRRFVEPRPGRVLQPEEKVPEEVNSPVPEGARDGHQVGPGRVLQPLEEPSSHLHGPIPSRVQSIANSIDEGKDVITNPLIHQTGRRYGPVPPRLDGLPDPGSRLLPDPLDKLRYVPRRPRPGRADRITYLLNSVLNPRSEEHTSELQSRENLVC